MSTPTPGADRPAGAAPIKVVRVIARMNIGGPARHVALLDEGLGKRGLDTILVHGTPAPHEGSLERLAADRSLRALVIPELGRSVRPWSDLRALIQLTRLVFRERPDVVHTHTAKAGTLGRLAALAYNATRRRHRRCLVVHTFHGHVLSGYFGRLGSTAVRWVERLLGRVTDRVVAISDAQRSDLTTRFAVTAPGRTVVIPLGLDLAPLLALAGRQPDARRRFAYERDDVVFGYVGRFAPVKDLDTLLRAFALVAHGSRRARLLMVGDGEGRPSLERLVRSLGLETAVTFAGWQLDLPAVYGAVNLVVLSSLNEGTPVALIEAMAAGLPVVATAVGGVPDIVQQGRTGALVPPRDAEALARSMLMLAEDRSLRESMGAAGRLSVQHRFGVERLVSDVEALYRDGLRRKRGAA